MKISYLVEKLSSGRQHLSQSNKKHRLLQYYVLYTVLFVFVCFMVFCWYFFTGRTFIWQLDGWEQHYKALVRYAQYLNSIINELLYNHRFVLPEWDFAIGEGNDILHSLHYYVIGDPFTLLSFLVPSRYMWIYYDFMVLFRLYLAGIAFSWLCFYTKKDIGGYAVMAGALSYVFCYWAIYNVNRHPYFLNPMIYFPLIILGIEKVLKKERAYLLIISVFLAAISNFYYYYVIVLLTVAYVAIRFLVEYKTDIRSMLSALLRIAGSSILGSVIGGVILLPVMFAFLNDSRMDSGNARHLVYPLSYYSGLLGVFFSGNGSYWLCLGYAAPVILAIFLLFMRKRQHQLLKICFLACSLIILIPAFGQVLNGMSYMSNKWCWAFALLCAYVFTVMWQELMELKIQDAAKLALFLSLCFLGLLMFEYSRTTVAFAGIGIAFIFLIVIFPFQLEEPQVELWKKWKQVVAIALVIIAVANVSFFKNASSTDNYADEAKTVKDMEEQFMLTETNAVESLAEADGTTKFYRFSGRGTSRNAGLMKNMSNTNYYWSISNPYIDDFRNTMQMREPLFQLYQGYDDRTALLALSSVKYFVVPDSAKVLVPYGFAYVDSINVKENITDEAKSHLLEELGTEELSDSQIKVIEEATASTYQIYRNTMALPIAYGYNAIISEDEWDRLSEVEKQEAMLQSVLLDGYDGETQDDEVDCSSRSLDYSIECDGTGVSLEDSSFVVTEENATATIKFEGVEDSETYFSINGLDFDGVSTYELYFGSGRYDPLNLFSETRWNLLPYTEREAAEKERLFWSEPVEANLVLQSSVGVTKMINYLACDHSSYNDRHDFTVNLDYTEDAVKSITVTFSAVGVYSYDSIRIICQPMDSYSKQVSALKKTKLTKEKVGTDTISGTVSLDEPKILCLSVPYSEGWTAYVDGEETKLYRANIKNMALMLDEGKHKVKLVYHTPFLRMGAGLSAMGVAVFVMLLLIDILKKRKLPGAKRSESL
ncbi:MAG: YfhO family protein [Lachnospiraceae bacterium]|nr:YfhO family protein [Lachnospiraceae bacterium]